MLEMVYNQSTTIALKFINLQHNLIISYMKMVIEFMAVDGLEYLWAERSRGSLFTPGLVDLQKFILSDRYHLTASALGRVCPWMTGLTLWITSFNCCRTSILLLMLNVFLKVKAVYFKVESTISSDSQCSTCSICALPTCSCSTIKSLGVEGPFLDEVGLYRVFWRNCHLAGCVGAFSHLLKCFSKLLAQLMVLLQWGHFSFLMGGSQWCCFSTSLLDKTLVHHLNLWLVLSIKHSIGCSICCISSSAAVNMASSWSSVKALLQPVVVDLI